MQVGAFFRNAQQTGLDYQVAVTTTDASPTGEQGRFVDRAGVRIITPRTLDPIGAFRDNAAVGTAGSDNERGLRASLLALTEPLISGVNAGFLRPDARLVIVYLSNEADHSGRADFLTPDLLALKPPDEVRAHAIVNDELGTCSGPTGTAQFAVGYIIAAHDTGGEVVSICDADWGVALSAEAGIGLRRRFEIATQAEQSSVMVTVDGTPVTGWRYDGRRTITFDSAAIPRTGAMISVTYLPLCN